MKVRTIRETSFDRVICANRIYIVYITFCIYDKLFSMLTCIKETPNCATESDCYTRLINSNTNR